MRPVIGLALLVALAAAVWPHPLSGQARVQLQGIADGELWSTDTNSNLLSRNGGKPAGLGRLQAWGAIETLRSLVFYGMFETQQGKAGETESEFEQYGVRFTPSSRFVLDGGRLPGIIGTFAARRFSNRNPLIGTPDGYPTQYPLGVQLSGAVRLLDYRVAMVSLPTVHEDYTPKPTETMRPAIGFGITPFVGVRIGASYTQGPYLNDAYSSGELASRSWKDYEQRVMAADLAVSVGYAELFAEVGKASYEVPRLADPVAGTTYYVEGKYTFTPRLYVAARVGRNDYPFIQSINTPGGQFWVARTTDFHDEEVGIGFRVSAGTLVKAAYRQDKWQVDAGNAAFVRPGGRAFAMQLSQTFDVMEWVDRARAR